MLTPVENGAETYERRALLDGDAVVLARAHGEPAEAVALRQLAQAPEVRPGGLGIVRLGRHRHQTLHVVVEAEETLELVLGDARFPLLPREVHLDQGRDLQTLRGRLARQRVAELAQLVHRLRLAALEVADE